jgi:Fur family ferric uptake transcriptional regulator
MLHYRSQRNAMTRTHETSSRSAPELIAACGGRVTRTRVAVLEVLQASAHPLTHDEIAGALAGADLPHDRVTLYRALDWLVAQGIAQRLAGNDRAWRFEAVHQSGHQHAHFHCDRCGHVICLDNLSPAFAVALPDGFQLERAELVFHGACADCGRQRVSAVDPGSNAGGLS